MIRVVLSWSNPAKAEKYREALAAAAAGQLALLDADARSASPGEAAAALDEADALLLTGGPDVVPARYGENEDPAAGVESIPARDELEWSLLAAARRRALPVLGICRGHQVVHAFLGGSLWQDVGAISPESRRLHDPDRGDRRREAHGITVAAGSSPLRDLLSSHAPLAVNSLHHQAVRRPGEGMAVAAVASDGVIEASSRADPSWWVWTVQWHPEELSGAADPPLHRRLFAEFLAAARSGARVPEPHS
ncbi:MAG: gamma-glutamyl-gamma-aminobutyrate hydrolase family protein [Thermoanaerobaculia bacterium]|nr:MAG: gamma-glutamyl-gamma-aminobutyrate hydrolase family protein [Thermoanaerobaculia bacterium]MBZ0100632.1 gamma-glutamyl-gamma-aminobutyrate hydrolase family protein [Thermoanaerobaculia bacterium]